MRTGPHFQLFSQVDWRGKSRKLPELLSLLTGQETTGLNSLATYEPGNRKTQIPSPSLIDSHPFHLALTMPHTLPTQTDGQEESDSVETTSKMDTQHNPKDCSLLADGIVSIMV